MIARELVGARKARSPRRREAWITFEDRAAGDATAAMAGEEYDPWVVRYQRGEITALVQRVREFEWRLRRRGMALAGAWTLVALGVIGSVGYWFIGDQPTPPEHPPVAVAPSPSAGGRQPIGVPAHPAGDVAIGAAAQAAPPKRLPPAPEPAPRAAKAATPEVDRPVAVTPAPPAARPEPAPIDPLTSGPLPVLAPTQVTLYFPGNSPDAEQLAAALARHLRSRGLSVGEPAPIALHPSDPGIAYFFDEDRDGAAVVGRILSGLMGRSRLVARSASDPLRRPGSVVVTLPAE